MTHLQKILFLIPLYFISCTTSQVEDVFPQGMKKATIGFKANVENSRAIATLADVKTNGFSVWGGYEGDNPLTVFDGRKVTTEDEGTTWIMSPTNIL